MGGALVELFLKALLFPMTLVLQRRHIALGIMFASLFLSACGRHRSVAAPLPRPNPNGGDQASSATLPPEPSSPNPTTLETGYASWYGDPYHGRRAANGEIYDKNKMTAAHRTLPFETMVKVTNLENDRTVTVRITDRGPFVKGRIIDLSLAAAKEISMMGPGTAVVRLEVLSANENPEPPAYAVQVAALRDRSAAEELRDQLSARYGGAFTESYSSEDGTFYRVRVGPKASWSQAQALATRLEGDRFSTFVVRLDRAKGN